MKDKEGDKGCDKEEDKRDIEPFQIHFKLDTVVSFGREILNFWNFYNFQNSWKLG